MATQYISGHPRRARGWQNVGVGEQWTSIAVGTGLLLAGYWLKGRTGKTLATTGAGLALRGATGWCPVYAARGVNRRRLIPQTRQALSGPRGVTVDEWVSIGCDVPVVYAFWRRLENLPRVIPHLESVTQIDDVRSHWVARGPLGVKVEWDADIINDLPNRLIAWRSRDGADLVSAGSVHFRRTLDGTDVHVRLQYAAPAGRTGATVAWLFGEAPGQEIREGLDRLRSELERTAGLVEG